jgi:peptidoglycan/LPS O-acetylase OafA/YrhL
MVSQKVDTARNLLSKMKRLSYLDALRGWAILSVIAFHVMDGRYVFPEEIKSIVLHGNKGVQLFYIISAFTIFLTLKQRSLLGNQLAIPFYIRRFFRIAPMYYVAICLSVSLFVLGIPYEYGEITAGSVLSNATFTHGASPFWINGVVPGGWSISVEIFFYLMAPFLFKRVQTLSASIFFLIGTLFVSALYNKFMLLHPVIENVSLWNQFVYFSFPNQLPVFAAGIVLYFLICEEQKITPEAIFALGIYILMGLLLRTFQLPVIVYFTIAFCFIMYSMSRKPWGLIINKFTVFAGRVSYSMYITHFAVLYFLRESGILNALMQRTPVSDFLHFLAMLFATTLGTLVVSSITYKWIEYPFQKLGKNIIRKIHNEKSDKVFA